MTAYASTGDSSGCARTFQKYLSYNFELTTVLMNINLASLIYTVDGFDYDAVNNFYKKFYGNIRGTVHADRFTYTQLFLACGKADRYHDAIKHMNNYLDSDLKLSVQLIATFKEAIGEEKYNLWKKKLSSKDIYSLHNAIDKSINLDTIIDLKKKQTMLKSIENENSNNDSNSTLAIDLYNKNKSKNKTNNSNNNLNKNSLPYDVESIQTNEIINPIKLPPRKFLIRPGNTGPYHGPSEKPTY